MHGCAACARFYNVLLAWSTVGSERACVAKTFEKPRRFGLQNYSREHSGEPQSSPSGPVQAKKNDGSASGASENLLVGSHKQFRARKCAAGARVRSEPLRGIRAIGLESSNG